MREIVCFLAFAAFSSCIITIGIAATKLLFWLQGIIQGVFLGVHDLFLE